jgi:hypothetical protein
MLLSEAEVEAWDTCEGRGQAAFSILARRLVLLLISLRLLVSVLKRRSTRNVLLSSAGPFSRTHSTSDTCH